MKELRLGKGIQFVGNLTWTIHREKLIIRGEFKFPGLPQRQEFVLMEIASNGRDIRYFDSDDGEKEFWESFQAKKLLYEFMVDLRCKCPRGCEAFKIDVAFTQLITDKFKPALIRAISHNLSACFHPTSHKRIYRAICALLDIDFDKYIP